MSTDQGQQDSAVNKEEHEERIRWSETGEIEVDTSAKQKTIHNTKMETESGTNNRLTDRDRDSTEKDEESTKSPESGSYCQVVNKTQILEAEDTDKCCIEKRQSANCSKSEDSSSFPHDANHCQANTVGIQTEWNWIQELDRILAEYIRTVPDEEHLEADDKGSFVFDDYSVLFQASDSTASTTSSTESKMTVPLYSRRELSFYQILQRQREKWPSHFQAVETDKSPLFSILQSENRPAILRYVRESAKPPESCQDPQERLKKVIKFLQKVKADGGRAKLVRSVGGEESISAVESGVSSTDVEEREPEEEFGVGDKTEELVASEKGRNCPFCGKTSQREEHSEEVEFCCGDAQELYQFVMYCTGESQSVEIIDINTGQKQKKVDRVRKKDVPNQKMKEKVKYSIETAFAAFSRNGRVINYQLSSPICMKQGWTVLPPKQQKRELPLQLPVEPIRNNFWMKLQGGLKERLYPCGSPFLLFFSNGSGQVFYPDGKIAILASEIDSGLQFTVFHYYHKRGKLEESIIATFDSWGNGTVHAENGSLRMHYSQLGGVIFLGEPQRLRRWKWLCARPHVHAPPLQPLCLAINRFMSLRILAQDDVILIFRAYQRSVRINVGTKLMLNEVSEPLKIRATSEELFCEDISKRIRALLGQLYRNRKIVRMCLKREI